MSSALKDRITEAMKSAMRARDKARLGAIRLILADIKRIEVDERIELDDQRVQAVLTKMVKQRRDSLAQYQAAGRDDLADQEQLELDVIAEFMPEQMSAEEIEGTVVEVIAELGVSKPAEMGRAMGVLKSRLQGKADMGLVSKLLKQQLSQRS